MNRITKRLAENKAKGRKALVSYIVHGDPQPSVTLPAMHALVAAGTDIIELGIPFSDPMAEGPVIQRGHERALEHHASLTSAITLVSEFRKTDQDTPVVLMGYANPIERMGYKVLATKAGEAGVDGLLTVDLPPEETVDLKRELEAVGMENILLIAPTTADKRVGSIAAAAGGFIYYVSLKGVTGAGHLDTDSVAEKMRQIRTHTQLPVLVGFGIKDRATAIAIGALADGVVVGSVLVEAMGSDPDSSADEICNKIAAILKPIRDGLDTISSS